MAQVKEHYHAKTIAAGVTVNVGVVLAGFLCKTAGSLKITDADGTVLVDDVSFTAGTFTRIPLLFNTSAGGTVVSTDAVGTLFL